jgi:Protein of unknown function (DUF4031)
MVYLDRHEWRGRQLSHVVADSLPELHAFMERLPCPRKKFHNKPGKPHYDLAGDCVEEAIAHGAVLVSTREIVRVLRRWSQQT